MPMYQYQSYQVQPPVLYQSASAPPQATPVRHHPAVSFERLFVLRCLARLVHLTEPAIAVCTADAVAVCSAESGTVLAS